MVLVNRHPTNNADEDSADRARKRGYRRRWKLGVAVAAAVVAAALNYALLRYEPFVEADYDKLYVSAETPRVTALSLDRQRLLVTVSDAAEIDTFSLDLSPGLATYRIGASHTLDLRFTPSEFYSAAGNSDQGNVHVAGTSLPIALGHAQPAEWLSYSESTFGSEDWRRAQALDAATVGTDGWSAELEAVYAAVYDATFPLRGTPTDTVTHRPPWEMYQLALAGKTGLWCDQLAKIFAFVACAKGIPARVVNLVSRDRNVRLTGHTLVEVFLRDRHDWAIVDITANALLFQDAHGHLLNVADVLHLGAVDPELADVRALTWTTDGFEVQPLHEITTVGKEYLRRDAVALYRLPEQSTWSVSSRLRRHLLSPDLVYSLSGHTSALWYVKISAAAAFAVSFAWLTALLVRGSRTS